MEDAGSGGFRQGSWKQCKIATWKCAILTSPINAVTLSQGNFNRLAIRSSHFHRKDQCPYSSINMGKPQTENRKPEIKLMCYKSLELKKKFWLRVHHRQILRHDDDQDLRTYDRQPLTGSLPNLTKPNVHI